MKNFFLLLFSLLMSITTSAQTLKTPTLDDLMWGGTNYWNLVPRSTPTAWWGDALVRTDVDRVTLLATAKGESLKNGPVLFTLDAVNAALDTARYGKVRNLSYAQFPDGKATLVELQTPKAHFYYNWHSSKVDWLVANEQGRGHEDFSYASRSLAFTKDFNLYVQQADGRVQQVSADGSRELLYGTSVHRDEFGISKGTYWNPDGTKLAFYRMDQSMVSDFPLVNIQVSEAARVAAPAPEKYPMAGMATHKVTVGIYDTRSARTVWLDLGDPTDRYFANIAWSADGKRLYLFEIPRSQDRADLVEFDATTGARLRTLYTETNAHYAEPMHPIVFLPWDESKFILQSRRDGFNHLYLFSADGKMLRQLTKGEYEVLEVLGFNEQQRSVIFRSNECGHIGENLFSLQLKTGKHTRLDNGVGVHRGVLSAGGVFVRDTWSKPDTYRVSEIVRTDRQKTVAVLDRFDSPWKDYKMPTIEGSSLLANDGKTPLYYRVVKPVDFDPAKKYPAVVYVYGGPHATNVKASWNFQARPWEYYMANKGYVVFVLDNRGSADRGLAFEQITHRRLGTIEMADQMQGVAWLKQQPWVDAERIGVHGWSFGGFMTTNLMLSHPETFKVGVAGGPVLDWKYYEAMYGERYMDTPQENPEGYREASMVAKAGQLKGRLQIIVGYNDPVCVLQHSMAFLRAAADAGTQPDYFVYPGQGHNMMGRDMVHLHERITRYFEDYLKPLTQSQR